MNSARGAAAEAIGALVQASESRVEVLLPAITALADDPSIAVRTCGAEALGALMRWRRSAAIDLLLKLADTEDTVLAAPPVQRMVAAGLTTHWPPLSALIERMLDSDLDSVVRAALGWRASAACRS